MISSSYFNFFSKIPIPFFLLLLCSTNTLFAQYFQQYLNYKIHVKLDDQSHTLDAFEIIEYTNHSPDTLYTIWFHLYPNAYKNNQTAFAQQKLQNKEPNFWYSKHENKGYIEKLDFRVNDKQVKWNYDSTHIDICQIHLNQGLPPGQTITISTPFWVKLPLNISRLGHKDQSYQISQWYPKPAVYDATGWHPMPYLDQGEFYSEWGNYEVKITLPQNYVVGATGYLQEETEKNWMNEKWLASQKLSFEKLQPKAAFPPSDTLYKVITFKIDSVHDFAWFADKRYHVMKEEINLANGNKVAAYALFTNFEADLWKNATQYIREAILFYSEKVGEYPYKICTVVQGALSAGGGMEYPTITIIGSAKTAENLETIILHEVGHNWFQGILATNERDFPWMDEGINSFYENQFLQQKYPNKKLLIGSEKLSRYIGIQQQNFHANDLLKLAYEVKGSFRKTQAIALSSELFTNQNFGVIVYGKTAWAFDYLKSYLGDSVFEKSMKHYYQDFAFKHPQPNDLQKIFELHSNKNLDWFFKEMIENERDINYKLKIKKKHNSLNDYRLLIKNKNAINYPISVGTYSLNTDSTQFITWWKPQSEDTSFVIQKLDKNLKFCLDCEKNIPTIHRSGFYSNRPFQPKFILAYDRPDKRELFFAPWYNWNNYDKSMLGLAFYNHTFLQKKLTFEVVPQYAFNTKTAVGMGNISYTFFHPASRLQFIKIGIQGRRFSWAENPIDLAYTKVQPTLIFELKPPYPRSHKLISLVLRNIQIWQELAQRDALLEKFNKNSQHYYLNEFAAHFTNSRYLYPFQASAYLQQAEDFVKLFSTAQFKININKRSEALHIRLFAGVFLWEDVNSGTLPDSRFRLNFSSGFGQFVKDYTFDEFLLGRSNISGFTSRQVVQRDGGFKTLTALGQTNDWLSSVNLALDVPVFIPIQVFMNLGAYGNDNSTFNAAFEGGFTLYAIRDVLAFHFPLFSAVQADFGAGKETIDWTIFKSKNNTNNPNFGISYRKLISFNFDLARLNPFEKLKEQVY